MFVAVVFYLFFFSKAYKFCSDSRLICFFMSAFDVHYEVVPNR